MKQKTKSIFLFVIMGVILLALTGCGNKTLVATKTLNEENDGIAATETLEVTFKGDKADKITATIEFEDEELAKTFEEYFKSFNEDFETSRENKKIVINMAGDKLEEFEGIKSDGSVSKEDLKKSLEDEGFEVKDK